MKLGPVRPAISQTTAQMTSDVMMGSLIALITGMVIAVAIGVSLGVLMDRSIVADRIFPPLVNMKTIILTVLFTIWIAGSTQGPE